MSHIETLKSALAARDRAGANAAVAALLDARAPLGEQWHKLSELMQVSGELTLAHRAIDAFVAESRNKPAARYSKVVLLTQSGKLREAHDLLASLPADVPERAGHAYVMGNTAITLGQIDEARRHLATAIRHRPGWGAAWLTLSSAINLAKDPLGDQLLADGPAAERQPPEDLARYCYALGKLHIDRGDHTAAFVAYSRGAQLLRGTKPYSRNGNAANAAAAMTGYDDAFWDRVRGGVARYTSRPIFVTGLPRSGTTLVEHIIASHSSVLDGGELNLIQHLAVAAGGVSGDAIAAYLDKGGTLDALADLYLHLLTERFGPDGRIVDKTVDASRYIGLIATALPDAPIIWMRRDPLDNAWSTFRTFFIHGVAWSYDLTDIAHHFGLEDRLVAFWQERLGERLLVVPYAALVDEPEAWIRRLLAHCNLPEEASAFAAHETKRAVATASSLQVRRPINRDGIGAAAPYREGMQPFIDAYFQTAD